MILFTLLNNFFFGYHDIDKTKIQVAINMAWIGAVCVDTVCMESSYVWIFELWLCFFWLD